LSNFLSECLLSSYFNFQFAGSSLSAPKHERTRSSPSSLTDFVEETSAEAWAAGRISPRYETPPGTPPPPYSGAQRFNTEVIQFVGSSQWLPTFLKNSEQDKNVKLTIQEHSYFFSRTPCHDHCHK
jgi:hypothetical protein